MSLTVEAKAALAVTVAASDAEADVERKAARAAATDAVRAALTRPDGTVLTMTEAGLTAKYADLEVGVVVWSDPDGVLLAAVLRDALWQVRLVHLVAGQYEQSSEQLASLADLGAALAAVR